MPRDFLHNVEAPHLRKHVPNPTLQQHLPSSSGEVAAATHRQMAGCKVVTYGGCAGLSPVAELGAQDEVDRSSVRQRMEKLTMTSTFPTGLTARAIETGDVLAPRFDGNGLIPAVATDATTGEVLMLAWMDAEALARTIATREAHYFSRSRNSLWRKGETSGHTQRVEEIRVDCDQDAVWLKVTPQGGGCVCHTGARSCFYRRVDDTGALIPASPH